MDRLLEPVKGELQQMLDRLAGRRFSTFEANRRLLRRMQHLLNRLRLGFTCPRPGCEKSGPVAVQSHKKGDAALGVPD